MKILYICADSGIPVLGTKGASVHVREMIAAWEDAGHSVLLAAPKLQKVPWGKPEKIAGTLLHLPPSDMSHSSMKALIEFETLLDETSPLPGQIRRILYNKELIQQLLRRFTAHPPDFIYERAALFSTVGTTVAAALDRPLILELNAPLADEQSVYRGEALGTLAKKAEQFVIRRADAILCVSSHLKTYAIDKGAKPVRVHVSPNGVNIRDFQEHSPAQKKPSLWRSDRGPVIGFVGGLRPWHGVRVLPELTRQLRKHYPDIRMVVAGEGPLRSELQADFARLGLLAQVHFTGAISHEKVAALIPTFDIAIAPYEKLDHDFYFSPLKLFEYMACGVALVAANAGQISEIVSHGTTALLYPPGVLDALIGQCRRLLEDRHLRVRLGRAAAKTVRSKYTWDHNAARAIAVAETLCAKKES